MNNLNLKKIKIVDAITKYQLYYHISLGNFVHETFLDLNETVGKIQELNLFKNLEISINKIQEIIKNSKNEKDIEESIRKLAMKDALKDFVENDKDLLNKDFYYKQRMKDIEENSYFNDKMKYNFEINYQKTYEYFNNIINDTQINSCFI
ncbi:hypothetical protein [Arcobacter arenosus]|jgi:uncharacterized membrane protein YgaE (UPF0421/DUF939 family)|uniref:Uncharacterized protein n=1 Tax=Arcobacter arenosus TaxID=2576037 RepID=A0A5R8Y021_9BACT|nr:hypothetical protein [Arcobacter arenosus]TLP37706.1 hypothetical protein FDK22_10335 [Arcobacter arenosus]